MPCCWQHGRISFSTEVENAILPYCQQEGRISFSTSGEIAEYGGCREVIGAICRQRSICFTLKLETPIHRTLPSFCSCASACQPSSRSASGSGQWIWYRSMVSTFKRRRLASHSRRTESAFNDRLISRFSFHTSAHFVKRYGRWERPASARATTSSEWPNP